MTHPPGQTLGDIRRAAPHAWREPRFRTAPSLGFSRFPGQSAASSLPARNPLADLSWGPRFQALSNSPHLLEPSGPPLVRQWNLGLRPGQS